MPLGQAPSAAELDVLLERLLLLAKHPPFDRLPLLQLLAHRRPAPDADADQSDDDEEDDDDDDGDVGADSPPSSNGHAHRQDASATPPPLAQNGFPNGLSNGWH